MTLQNFLENFHNDATSFRGATEEIRDLSRVSREILEEIDGVKVAPVNFANLTSPAAWNTVGKESILNNVSRMSDAAKEAFLFYANMFEIDSL